jgi:hypothetical protein
MFRVFLVCLATLCLSSVTNAGAKRARPALPVPHSAAELNALTIETGEVYVNGNQLISPFRFEMTNGRVTIVSPSGRATLYVHPSARPQEPRRSMTSYERDLYQLMERADRDAVATLRAGKTETQAIETMAATFRSRPDLVSDVKVDGLYVVYSSYVFAASGPMITNRAPLPNLNPAPARSARSADEETLAQIAEIIRTLKEGGTVIYGDAYPPILVPPKRLTDLAADFRSADSIAKGAESIVITKAAARDYLNPKPMEEH